MSSQFVEESCLHVDDGTPATHPYNKLGSIISFGVDVVEIILRRSVRIRTNELVANIVHTVRTLQTNTFTDRVPRFHCEVDGNTLKEGKNEAADREKKRTHDAVTAVQHRMVHIGQCQNVGRFQLDKNVDGYSTLTKQFRRYQDFLKKERHSRRKRRLKQQYHVKQSYKPYDPRSARNDP